MSKIIIFGLLALVSSVFALPTPDLDTEGSNMAYVKCPDGSGPILGAQGPVPCTTGSECPPTHQCVNQHGTPAGICCANAGAVAGTENVPDATNGTSCPPPPQPTPEQAQNGCKFVARNDSNGCSDIYDMICASPAPLGGEGAFSSPSPLGGEGTSSGSVESGSSLISNPEMQPTEPSVENGTSGSPIVPEELSSTSSPIFGGSDNNNATFPENTNSENGTSMPVDVSGANSMENSSPSPAMQSSPGSSQDNATEVNLGAGGPFPLFPIEPAGSTEGNGSVEATTPEIPTSPVADLGLNATGAVSASEGQGEMINSTSGESSPSPVPEMTPPAASESSPSPFSEMTSEQPTMGSEISSSNNTTPATGSEIGSEQTTPTQNMTEGSTPTPTPELPGIPEKKPPEVLPSIDEPDQHQNKVPEPVSVSNNETESTTTACPPDSLFCAGSTPVPENPMAPNGTEGQEANLPGSEISSTPLIGTETNFSVTEPSVSTPGIDIVNNGTEPTVQSGISESTPVPTGSDSTPAGTSEIPIGTENASASVPPSDNTGLPSESTIFPPSPEIANGPTDFPSENGSSTAQMPLESENATTGLPAEPNTTPSVIEAGSSSSWPEGTPIFGSSTESVIMNGSVPVENETNANTPSASTPVAVTPLVEGENVSVLSNESVPPETATLPASLGSTPENLGPNSQTPIFASTPESQPTPQAPESPEPQSSSPTPIPSQLNSNGSNPDDDISWDSMFSIRSPQKTIPDAVSFRRGAGPAVPTSGQWYPCQRNADCFHLREPAEWCQTNDVANLFTWTDKSCFCAADTEVQSCIIERFDFPTGKIQWTFCTPDTELNCDNVVRRRKAKQ